VHLLVTDPRGVRAATTVYAYDDLNRPLSATKDGVPATCTYDLDGNRASEAVAGGATDTYTWDVNDRARDAGSARTLAHDAQERAPSGGGLEALRPVRNAV
jgi:YD repeat-containing protein